MNRSYFALITAPQRELVAAAKLRNAGITALVPTELKWPRCRKGCKPPKHPRIYPLYTRYVFAGFDGPPDWLAVHKLDAVQGVVGFEGRPAQVARNAVWQLMQQETRVAPSSAPAPHKAFKVGDEAEIIEGPFAGHVVKINDIIAGKAKVLMGLFGTSHVTQIAIDNLEAA